MSALASPPPPPQQQQHDSIQSGIPAAVDSANAPPENHTNGNVPGTADHSIKSTGPPVSDTTAAASKEESNVLTTNGTSDSSTFAVPQDSQSAITSETKTLPIDPITAIAPSPITEDAPAPVLSDLRNEKPAPPPPLTKIEVTPAEPTPEPTPTPQPVVGEPVSNTSAVAATSSSEKASPAATPDPMAVLKENQPPTRPTALKENQPPTGLKAESKLDALAVKLSPRISLHVPAQPQPKALELSPAAIGGDEAAAADTRGDEKDNEMRDISTSVKVAREREEDDEAEDDERGPTAKRARTEDDMDVDAKTEADAAAGLFKAPETPAAPITTVIATTAMDVDGKEDAPSTMVTTTTTAAPLPTVDDDTAIKVQTPPTGGAPDTPTAETVSRPQIVDGKIIPLSLPDYGPMTDYQNKKLQEGIRNMKKGKHSTAFQKPVDYVAMNLPSYPDIVKQPMDIGTMENKLKNGDYKTVNEYVDDFDLMVNNCVLFNGAQHVVTQNALNLRAQFQAQLKKIPGPGEAPPDTSKKAQRKSSVSIATPREPARRASRPSFGAAVQSPSSAAPTYALDTNGLPLIRRDSSTVDGRPKREIHKPPPRDLPYSNAKPRKKKFQMELKFCDWLLSELKLPRYDNLTYAFKEPVDPVALNIPQYLKMIKHPMDLATVSQKLAGSEYENAKEVHADMKLIFNNCYKFNGPTHPVSTSARELERIFDDLWSRKDEWISDNAPASSPQSPIVPESESEPSEDEEETAEERDARQAQLAQVQKQIALLSQQAMDLMQPPVKPKVKKSKKSGGDKADKAGKGDTAAGSSAKNRRKSHGTSVNTPSGKGGARGGEGKKSRSKGSGRTKPVTMAEKQEISNNIGALPQDQINIAANLIKASLRRAGKNEIADAEDLEFDIDMIPDDALHELLKLVRKFIPNTAAPTPARSSAAQHHQQQQQAKQKKNKPMSKHEQEDRINRLKGQLESFQNQGGPAAVSSPDNDAIESSGDDEESGSESEEE